jgi:hypothetical protein
MVSFLFHTMGHSIRTQLRMERGAVYFDWQETYATLFIQKMFSIMPGKVTTFYSSEGQCGCFSCINWAV